MELLQLKYFLELAQKEHLTEVSQSMYVSPSAISNSISRLEEELGVQLFDRRGRRIYLNYYGKMYFEYVKRALEALNDGKRKIEEEKTEENLNVTVASYHPDLLKTKIEEFMRKNSKIAVNLIDCSFKASVYEVSERENVDLIIAAKREFQDDGWDEQCLFTDKLAVAVSAKHVLAGKESIFLEEVKDESFVCLPPSPFSLFCEEACRKAGFELHSRIICDTFLRPKIAEYENMVILTLKQCGNFPLYQNMHIISLKDKYIEWDTCIFWKKQRYLPHGAVLLRDFLIGEYAGTGRRNKNANYQV